MLQINRRKISIAAALIALGTALTAQAQTEIRVGSVIQGRIAPGDLVQQIQAGKFSIDCYVLNTEPGEQITIQTEGEMNSWIGIIDASQGCLVDANLIQDGKYANYVWNRTNARVEFTAGGGSYLVRVLSWKGNADYTLRVSQGTSSGVKQLRAGATQPWRSANWVPPTASTTPDKASEDLAAGTIFRDCADVCPEMVVLPAGSFMMGSPANEADRSEAEGPRHAVAFAYPFAMGRYEVTFDEYDACVADKGCSGRAKDNGWGRGRRPVIIVTWNDAQEYVAWLSRKTGAQYHLPSEAEWEYAARGGRDTPWHTGNAILAEDANILNQFEKTVAVGSYPPNPFGLHDMHGNVAEWTLDCLDTGYIGVPTDGSAAVSGGCAAGRIWRGGNYLHEPGHARSAQRAVASVDTHRTGIGFRVARSL